MTHPDDDFDPGAPRLWDADPDVCCAAFQLGACAHTESHDYDENIEASRLLDEHHAMVPVSNFNDEIADNCAVCGFAAGWLPGEESPGHATTFSVEEVHKWIATQP